MSFGAKLLACVMLMAPTPALIAQTISPPARDAETAIARSQQLTDPVRRCQPAGDGVIVVCGNDTEDNRLSPELRAVAAIGQSTKDSIARAPPANAATLSKLPFNWHAMGGRYGSPPEFNPLFELVKKRTGPDQGVAAAPDER